MPLTEEGRKKIAAAQKKRWREYHKQQKLNGVAPVKSNRKK